MKYLQITISTDDFLNKWEQNGQSFVKTCCPYLTTLLSGSPIIQDGKLVGAQRLQSKLAVEQSETCSPQGEPLRIIVLKIGHVGNVRIANYTSLPASNIGAPTHTGMMNFVD